MCRGAFPLLAVLGWVAGARAEEPDATSIFFAAQGQTMIGNGATNGFFGILTPK